MRSIKLLALGLGLASLMTGLGGCAEEFAAYPGDYYHATGYYASPYYYPARPYAYRYYHPYYPTHRELREAHENRPNPRLPPRSFSVAPPPPYQHRW
jgi:hypothetical protein